MKGTGVGGEGLHLAGFPILAETGVLAELGTLPNTLFPEAGCFWEDLRFAGTGDSVVSSSS